MQKLLIMVIMIQKIYNSEYNITINNKEYPKVALCAIVKRKK